MAKRVNLGGTSMRHGRAPSPYTKRLKAPFWYPNPADLRKKYPSSRQAVAELPVVDADRKRVGVAA